MILSNSPGGGRPNDLSDTRAVITGVGGFLGRSLANQLAGSGAEVLGLDVHEQSLPLSTPIRYQRVDMLNLDLLCGAMTQVGVPADREVVVFHLAGQSHVGQCRLDPSAAFALNVLGTSNVLEACRKARLTRVIFPSTALVYALPARLPLDEDSPVWPKSVYAATKLAAESLLKGYAADYGFSCRIARLGNVYGEGGSPDSVISILLRQVKRGGPISLKSLAPIRDFIYRDDVVRGLIALADHSRERGCHVFNLASGIATSIGELAEAASRAGDVGGGITETDPRSCDADDMLVLSIKRISDCLSWRPVWMLEDGLRKTLSEMAMEGP